MVVDCAECGAPFARKSREKRCPACNPAWQRERARLAEQKRRRARGVPVYPSAAPLNAAAAAEFDDPWFAGFTDGEGCFYIGQQGGRHSVTGWRPGFSISLRDDDAEVLIRLRDAFGGRLVWRPRVCSWQVMGKEEMARIVAYFDRHPLRAKKARDYAIWREAVSVYCRGSYRSSELELLRETLMAGREYQGTIAPRLEVAHAG